MSKKEIYVNTCLYCKIEFETTKKNKKYCSEKCCAGFHSKKAWQKNKKSKIKTCEYCGKEFTDETKFNTKKYCSDDCHKNWMKENPRYTKICPGCGIEYKTNWGSQKYCSRKCSGLASTENNRGTNNDKNKEEFIKYLNDNYKYLKLISDYVNATTYIKLKCSRCESTFDIRPESMKREKYKGCTKCQLKTYKCNNCNKEIGTYNNVEYEYGRGDSKRYYCSEECLIEKEIKTCEVCMSKFFTKKSNEKTCSDTCKELLKENRLRLEHEQRRIMFVPETRQCKYCGEEFQTTFERQIAQYCSDACKNKNQNKNKDIKRRQRIIENGEVDLDITLPKLYDNFKAICAICGEKCNYDDYTKTEEGYFIAGDDYPSIDHIIPVAKGGTHTWNNIQLAHRRCNTIKSDGFIEEEGQLRII